MPTKGLFRTAAAIVGLVLFASACGGGEGLSAVGGAESNDSTQDSQSAPLADDSNSETTAQNELPAVPVINVATGEEVVLSSFAPAPTPIVLWFWAPH